MSVYRISYRYANSFFQNALQKKVLDKYAADVELVFNTLAKSKELRVVLKTPIVKQKDKLTIVNKIFSKKVGKDTLDFIEFIIKKNREEILFEIMQEFLNLRDQKEGIVRAKITSSIELKDSVKKLMKSSLEKQMKKKIQPEYDLNEKIIGGFVFRINDTVMDASVKHQLELLRKKFSEEISI